MSDGEFQFCVSFCLVAAAERDQNIACLKAALKPGLITTRQKMDEPSRPQMTTEELKGGLLK